jgi:hypothetical protein
MILPPMLMFPPNVEFPETSNWLKYDVPVVSIPAVAPPPPSPVETVL